MNQNLVSSQVSAKCKPNASLRCKPDARTMTQLQNQNLAEEPPDYKILDRQQNLRRQYGAVG
jgi:hypothetical protein